MPPALLSESLWCNQITDEGVIALSKGCPSSPLVSGAAAATSTRARARLRNDLIRYMFRVAAPGGSFIVASCHDTERQRVADVIGDAFEYDAWFKKDGEPRPARGRSGRGGDR